MYKWLKRFLCAVLISALALCALPAPAMAQGRIGYVVDTALPVYAGPHTASRVLGCMVFGEMLWVRAWKNGWAQVMNRSGNVGYCLLSGLSADDPNTLNMNAYVKSGGATVYAKPSTAYSVRVGVAPGACYTAVGMTRDGQWVRLKNGSIYGYALASELSPTPTGTTVWISAPGAVSVSADPNPWGGTSIGTASFGQSFELLSIQDDCAQIRNASGRVGWVHSSVISYTDPNNLDATFYAQVSGNVLWPQAIIRGTAKPIKAGTPVQIVARASDGDWIRVKYEGSCYYATGILFSSKPAPDGGQIIYCPSEGYTVHAGPSTSAEVLATLQPGEAVQLIGVSDSGSALLVRTKSGVVGYTYLGGWVAGS